MALTARAMASAAQGLRSSGLVLSSPAEPSNCCRSSISARRCGLVHRQVRYGPIREHLRWDALVWSSRKARRKRRSLLGSWHCLQADMQQVLDDGNDGTGEVRKARSAVAQNGRHPTNGMMNREVSVAESRTDQAEVTSEVGTSGRPRKSRSSGSNGIAGRKQKPSKTTAKDGEHASSKVDGFLSDYSDSDVEDSGDHSWETDSEAGRSADYGDSSRERVSITGAKGDGRVSGGVREQSSGQEEIDLRFMFLEAIMERARNSDVEGVEEAMSGMALAGLKAGPRAYHGLVVAYARSGDSEGALQALKKGFVTGAKPLPETLVAVARLFGANGEPHRGKEILAAMEKLNYNPRVGWLVLVEELFSNGHLQEANEVFLEGLEGGMRGTNELYDRIVEADCKVGDHSNAVSILRVMEYSGRMSTTAHYNCLLMAQALADVPDITAMTFDTMQYGRDEMKPDTESYNWLIQAHTRHKFGDRCQEVVDLLGEMVEDHKRVQPNMKTYALLVECFTKYDHVNEAVRHFRALAKFPGAMNFLYNEGHGRESDPLSLYLRALCLEGRAGDMVEALEAMLRDNQPLPARALLINKRGRSLVSSWIEPLQQEADLGYDVDYVARFLAEGGGDGTRKRWSASASGRSKSPDDDGFAYAAPVEVSYKGFLTQMRRVYNLRLLRKLRLEGVHALGPNATEADVQRVFERLVRETLGDVGYQVKKPKAASKMLVSELKEELEAQGLPTEGTRPVLYQRVQKARRINRARGRPLWVPPSEEEGEEGNDEELDVFMERLNLKNENTEFWRKRFTGEDVIEGEESLARASVDTDDDTFTDDDEDEEDEDVEVEDDGDDLGEDGGEEDEGEPPEMLAMQLLKNKKDMPEKAVVKDQERSVGEWLGLTLEEKITMLKTEKRVDVSELYTIADVWNWTWERELREAVPEPWTQEKEVQLGIEIMLKVQELGGVPTIGDMGALVRAAMRTPWPEALISLLQHSHKLGYVFGSKLYSEAVRLCMSLGEKDAAINIITDMEAVGVAAPEDLLTDILRESEEGGKLENLVT